MISPILLIAEREFRTYVATLSFWLSLLLAPLAAGAALFFWGGSEPSSTITIEGGDRLLAQSARVALEESGRLEGRQFLFDRGGAKLVLSMRTPQELDMTFGAGFPLSPVGRAMVGHIIERDVARHGAQETALVVQEKVTDASNRVDAGAVSRFISMLMLWLALTGSLGMLLQAVVRERANRALESLLAAAQGWQIVAGKIAGVGGVSFLVLGVWNGTAAALSLFAGRGSPLSVVTAGLSNPSTLLRDALIYVFAFAFYGAITVMLGALARDSASAQNAARPMFVLLLVGFFLALATVGKSPGTLSWLTWLPPFTPFLLLVESPGSVTLMSQAFLLGLLLLASLAMLLMASRLLTIVPATYRMFGGNRRGAQALE